MSSGRVLGAQEAYAVTVYVFVRACLKRNSIYTYVGDLNNVVSGKDFSTRNL